jgi:hypothetical protein
MWLRTIVTPGGRVVQEKLAGEHTHTDGSSPEAFAPRHTLRQQEALTSDASTPGREAG